MATKKIIKKSIHKKKEELDLSALPNGADMPDIDSVAKPLSADDLHNSLSAQEPTAEQKEMMRDIKPREFRRDATFLVPEKFGFDLKIKNENKTSSAAPKIIYAIIGVIIILFVALFALNHYSNKLVSTTDNSSGSPASAADQSQNYNLGIADFSADLKTPLIDALKNNFKTGVTVSDSTATLPAFKADTLFVKQSNQQQTADILNFLGTYGIKAEVLQQNDLPADAVLALAPIISNPDLSGLTASVYNATGTSGLAKKNCDILIADKAISCNALNAGSNQTGTTVNYKTPKVLFILKRTAQFQKAVFSAAVANQVEDIRVTVGK